MPNIAIHWTRIVVTSINNDICFFSYLFMFSLIQVSAVNWNLSVGLMDSLCLNLYQAVHNYNPWNSPTHFLFLQFLNLLESRIFRHACYLFAVQLSTRIFDCGRELLNVQNTLRISFSFSGLIEITVLGIVGTFSNFWNFLQFFRICLNSHLLN